MSKNKTTYVFVDASNLFYGGEKSLGWKIDYKKLHEYLKEKYEASKLFYYGGVEIHRFGYDYLKSESVPVDELERYLTRLLKEQNDNLNEAEILLTGRHLQRVRFYLKLQEFGYKLFLKPVKLYEQDDGTTKRKANVDVEMTFHLMKCQDEFDRVVILSGDGDFLPVLKFLQEKGKEVIVLARGSRTAKEIRQFAGGNFRDFARLRKAISFDKK